MSKVNFALLGRSTKHSFSPSYFKNKFDTLKLDSYSYTGIELENIMDFNSIDLQSYRGMNVTIPYKTAIIPLIDYVSPLASHVRAVNTIYIDKANRTYGFNTDCYGFRKSLIAFLPNDFEISALVLGTGGASNAISHVLDGLGITYKLVSRNATESSDWITYNQLNTQLIDNNLLIINTTPVGMYPDIESKPSFPYEAIGSNHYLFDLIYNPEKTVFLKEGEQRNAHIQNGYKMLTHQADKSWEIWNKLYTYP